jgi:hypothetical protein
MPMSHHLNPSRTLSAALFLLAAAPLFAQAPSAPIPTQLTTAKSIFLANAGSLSNQLAVLAYNNLYQGLTAEKRYQLTATPEDADLIFEVSVIFVYGGQTNVEYVQLVVRDAKSQSLLWSISENIGAAAREKTLEKNLADTTAKLITDLATLTSNKVTTSPPTPK